MKSFVAKYLLIFAITSLLVLLLLRIFEYPLVGVDDANIFFVYAKNLADGRGFVYNIGGERVEGFTSLLWVILGALTLKVTPHLELVLLIVNMALVVLGTTLALICLNPIFSFGSRSSAKLPWEIAFIILLYSMPAYLTWNTIPLMDNAVWCTLLLATTLTVINAHNMSVRNTNWLFTIIIVLMLLTRPEAILWVVVFLFVFYLLRLPQHGSTQAVRTLTFPILAYILTISTLTIFRLAYFGFPLPNTFYAKVSPSVFYNVYTGMKYLVLYFFSHPLIQLCLLAVVFTMVDTLSNLFRKQANKINGLSLLPLIAVTGLLIPVITGGDHFGSYRFYQNVYPILILNLFYLIKCVLPKYIGFSLASHSTRLYRYIFCIVIALAFLMVQANQWRLFKKSSKLAHEFLIAEEGRERGKFMASLFSELANLPKIGVVVAGAQKVTYPGEIIDLMGLNNIKMGHNKGKRRGTKNHAAFEKATFYQLKPDIITPMLITEGEWSFNPDTLSSSFANRTLKGLFDDRQFQDLYVYGKITIYNMKNNRALIAWIRKDFASYLVTEKTVRIELYDYTTHNNWSVGVME